MEQALHPDQDDRGAEGDEVQPRARRHADARRRPYARRRRQTVDLVLAVDDDARTQKPDAGHDLRRHARGIVFLYVRKPVFGYDHDQCRTRAHDGVRTDTCLFIAQLSLVTDGKPQHHSKQDIQQIIQLIQNIRPFSCPDQDSTDFFNTSAIFCAAAGVSASANTRTTGSVPESRKSPQ